MAFNLASKDPVVILAGGKGMRMREYSDTLPKGLVPIGPHPVILHVMGIFASFGHKNFIVCLGYMGDTIRQYFMNYEWMTSDFTLQMGPTHGKQIKNRTRDFLDFEITFADTALETQTGGRIKKIEKYVESENFLVSYCDNLSDVDISQLVAFHKKMGKIGTVTAVHAMSSFGVIEIDENELASSFREKPTLPGYINGGFYVFNREFFDYLAEDSVLELEPLERLAHERQLAAFRHEGFWACMDTFKDVERLNTLWKTGYMPHMGYRGKAPWSHSEK